MSLAALGAMAGSLALSSSALGFVAPVSAGPPSPLHVAHLDFDGFFPSKTKIHVGDSVSFSINGFHTVSFLAAGESAPPLIIPSSSLVEGKLDAEGKKLWFNGQPNQVINPVAAAPAGGTTYTGSGYLSSGLPAGAGPPPPFVVTFTKSGTFTFNCLVHPGMKGSVTVLPAGTKVPTVAQDRAKAHAQAAAALAEARILAKIQPAARNILAGNDRGAATWLRFFPEKLKIKAGTTVTFRIDSPREVHTVTFGPVAYTRQIEETFTTAITNPKGPPTLLVNPFGAYPSDPLPLPPYTGANHGNGFEGAGILGLGGPLHSSVQIKFTTPGTYRFECVIHENMDGTIVVTK